MLRVLRARKVFRVIPVLPDLKVFKAPPVWTGRMVLTRRYPGLKDPKGIPARRDRMVCLPMKWRLSKASSAQRLHGLPRWSVRRVQTPPYPDPKGSKAYRARRAPWVLLVPTQLSQVRRARRGLKDRLVQQVPMALMVCPPTK